MSGVDLPVGVLAGETGDEVHDETREEDER